jgi:hypothetical protein
MMTLFSCMCDGDHHGGDVDGCDFGADDNHDHRNRSILFTFHFAVENLVDIARRCEVMLRLGDWSGIQQNSLQVIQQNA